MAEYKVQVVKGGEFVSPFHGAYVTGDASKDYVWTNKEQAKKAIRVCEKYWGKMRLIAA